MIVIRDGSVEVRIYETPSGKYKDWTVAYRFAGKRARRHFTKLTEAKAFARAQARKISNGQIGALNLSSDDAATFQRATDALRPSGKPLDLAVLEYVEAMKALAGAGTLHEAVKQFRARNLNASPLTPEQITAELIASKTSDGLSPLHLKDLRVRLGKFCRSFQCPLSAISGPDIDTWLRTQKGGGRNRNNYRLAIQNLYSFAKQRRHLPESWDEMKSVPLAREPAAKIQIFSPAEMRTLLDAAPPDLAAFMALAGFAGLRHEELKRQQWEDINFQRRFIRVTGAKGNTPARRLAPLPPCLAAWLAPVRQLKGALVDYNSSNRLLRLAARVGIKWKKNALRHSFISYRVAATQNVNQVALEAGNSPRIIFSNYRELVSAADGRKWFKICPENVRKNIVPMKTSTKAG